MVEYKYRLDGPGYMKQFDTVERMIDYAAANEIGKDEMVAMLRQLEHGNSYSTGIGTFSHVPEVLLLLGGQEVATTSVKALIGGLKGGNYATLAELLPACYEAGERPGNWTLTVKLVFNFGTPKAEED